MKSIFHLSFELHPIHPSIENPSQPQLVSLSSPVTSRTMEQVQSLVLDPLKPYLLPITKNLPAPVDNFIIGLLGAPCHAALFLDLDVSRHPECLQLAISKALSIAIVSAASIVKVPQILKLVTSRSAQGLSLTSYLLESTAFLITLAYNVRHAFPFSTYGETALILIQDVVITVLICLYARPHSQPATAGAFLAFVLAALYALIVHPTLVTTQHMSYLQTTAGLLAVASKLPPILTVYREGGTGQLSAFAVFNYLAGSASRIYTTLQEVPDPLILWSFVGGFLLNAVLGAQMLYYWNSPTTAKHAAEVDRQGKLGLKGVAQHELAGVATEERTSTLATGVEGKSASGRRKG